VNLDSEKVEGLCFPLLFPHGKPGYTNVYKHPLSPDAYVMSRLLRPEKRLSGIYMTAEADFGPYQYVDSRTGEPFVHNADLVEVN
jgi:hypothetical protein